MGQRIVVYCDMTGADGAEPHEFSVDGRAFKLDLCADKLGELMAALEPFMAAATAERRGSGGGRAPTNPHDRKAVRAWAATVGIDIPRYGQIKREVWEQWVQAGSPRPAESAA